METHFQEGSQDFDNALVTHMVEEFRKDQEVDIAKDAMAPRQCMSQLKDQIELQALLQADVNLPCALVNKSGPKHLNMKTQGPNHQNEGTSPSVKDAEVTKYDIEVVLSGGWDDVDAQSAGDCAATLSLGTQQL